MSGSGFSDISVWRQTTVSGFRQQAFIMFHGTDPDAASSIVREQRFRISTGPDTMLGNGVYVSASRAKAQAYGQVIFKLLVYPGDVCRVDYQGHPWQKTWQKYYDSAWVPRNCGMVPSGLEVIRRSSDVSLSTYTKSSGLLATQNIIFVLRSTGNGLDWHFLLNF